MNRIVKIAVALMLVAAMLCGCNLEQIAGDQQFTCEELTITVPALMADLTENEQVNAGYDFVLSSTKVVIFGMREDFADFEGIADTATMTVEDYGQMIIEANGMDTEIVDRNGLPTFTFDADVDGASYKYLAAVYKSGSAFWLLQSSALAEDYEAQEEKMLTYLSSVTFAD